MHMYTERTQVLLTPEQRRRLDQRAAEEHRSTGAVIRAAVDAYLGGPRGLAGTLRSTSSRPAHPWTTGRR